MRKILFLLLFPCTVFSQDFRFDETWEGTYFCPSDSGRITFEIFYPSDPGEYLCSIKTKTDTIHTQCLLSEKNIYVNDCKETMFVLYPSGGLLKTRWTYPNAYSFYPEPELECYYEPEE